MADVSSKFYQFPPATPWPDISGAKYVAAGDIDGDGCDELLGLNLYQGIRFFGTISHINRGELTPLWNTSNSDWGGMALIDSRLNRLGPWTFSDSDSFLCADLDGDGADEVFVFNGSSAAAVFDWSLQGSGATASLEMNAIWTQSGNVSGAGKSSWPLKASNDFVAADIDGDHSEELIVFDGQHTLGVWKWRAGALQVIQILDSAAPGGPGMTPWYLFPADRFQPIRLGGRELIAAFDGTSWLGLLEWTTDGLSVLWSSNAPLPSADGNVWRLAASDRLFVADLDGDGDQELFLFDGQNTIAAAKWQGGTFEVLYKTSARLNAIAGSGQWTMASTNWISVTPGKTADWIAVFDNGQLGSLAWQDSAIQLLYVGSGTVTGPSEEAWSFSASDRFIPGNYDGTGFPQVFVSDKAESCAVLKWNQIPMWTASRRIPSWNLDYVLAAPPAPLQPFTGSRLAVYQYISNAVYADSEGDIRSEYTNTNITAGSYESFSSQIAQMSNPPGQGFSQSDSDAVQHTLVPELQCVDPLDGLFTNLNQLALDVDNQQDLDLTNAVQLVDKKIADKDEQVSYWIGQFLDALAWAAAVGPEEKANQAFLAALGSLFGGYLGSQQQPQNANYSDFRQIVDETYKSARERNGANQTQALGDAALLAVIGKLASQSWNWNPSSSSEIAANTENSNRIAFYQILIPVRFQIVEFPNNATPYPYVEAMQEAPWSYWSLPGSIPGAFDVYMLAYPDELFHPYGFPSRDLMNDLFNNLSVAPADFFLGRWGWSAIPRVTDNGEVQRLRQGA